MLKLKEYVTRAFVAAIISGMAMGPILAAIIMLLTGVHGSPRFAIGSDILAAILLFFLPVTKKLTDRSEGESIHRDAPKEETQKGLFEKLNKSNNNPVK